MLPKLHSLVVFKGMFGIVLWEVATAAGKFLFDLEYKVIVCCDGLH
jgi:hypothetical protein